MFSEFELFESMINAREKSGLTQDELARMAKMDVKNVAEDIKYLEQIGLIEKKETDHKTAPVTKYDRIALEIAV